MSAKFPVPRDYSHLTMADDKAYAITRSGYYLLLAATILNIISNILLPLLGVDASAITLGTIGAFSKQTVNNVVVQETSGGMYVTWLNIAALVLAVIALLRGFLMRKDVPVYYYEHGSWQANTFGGYFLLYLAFALSAAFWSSVPLLTVFPNVLLDLWFLYRNLHGLRQLNRKQPVRIGGMALD